VRVGPARRTRGEKGAGFGFIGGAYVAQKMFQQLLGLGEDWQVTQMNYLEK
jgi:hypothetical protein